MSKTLKSKNKMAKQPATTVLATPPISAFSVKQTKFNYTSPAGCVGNWSYFYLNDIVNNKVMYSKDRIYYMEVEDLQNGFAHVDPPIIINGVEVWGAWLSMNMGDGKIPGRMLTANVENPCRVSVFVVGKTYRVRFYAAQYGGTYSAPSEWATYTPTNPNNL